MKGFPFTSGLLLIALLSLQSQLTFAAYSMKETCANSPSGYIADPDDCQSYGYCDDGVLVGTRKCDPGFLYDSRMGQCNHAYKVQCNTKLESTCTNFDSPVYLPNPTDCTKACYCNPSGKYSCATCPPHQYFKPDTRACVWAKDYACPANSICRLVRDNIFVSDPENCGNYISCFAGSGKSEPCDAGYWFNPRNGNCEDVNICQDTPSPTDPEAGVGVDQNLPSDEKACKQYTAMKPGVPFFVSDKKTCMGYYACTDENGPGNWYKCPMGTHFNEAKQECVTPFTFKCDYDRCGNINQQYVSEIGCTSYVFCKNQKEIPNYGSSCADLNKNFPYFDEFYGSCVNVKPNYAICTI